MNSRIDSGVIEGYSLDGAAGVRPVNGDLVNSKPVGAIVS